MAHDTERGAAPAASAFERLAAIPARIAGAVATALILAVFALIVVAVVGRYVFSAPVPFTDEVAGWALVAIVTLGAAEAYRRGDHIAIDLLTSRAPARARPWVAAFADLAVIGFSVVLGWSAWTAISFARGFGMYTTGHIEMETWILQTPIFVGAALLGLIALARMLGRFRA